MAVVPTIAWQNVACPGVYEWSIGTQGGQPSGTISGLAHSPSSQVFFDLGVSGAFSTTVTGNLTIGETTISSLSSVADLAAGQAITALGYLPRNTAGGNASVIATVGASSCTFANGVFNEDTNSYPNTIPAPASASGVTFTIGDPTPIGSLAAVVTPSTGVTITDQNSDGSGNVSHFGNGSVIANLIGAAEGSFDVSFGSAGTFSVSCIFTTGDPNYSSVSVSPPIVCVVT